MSMLGKEMAALRPLGSTVLCDLHHLIRKQLLILKLQFFSTMKVATIDILQLLRYCYVVIVGWYSYTHKSLFTQWSSALQQNSDPLSSGLTGVLDVYSTVQTSNRAHAKRSTPVILICVLLKKRNYTKFCVLLPNFELECFFPKNWRNSLKLRGDAKLLVTHALFWLWLVTVCIVQCTFLAIYTPWNIWSRSEFTNSIYWIYKSEDTYSKNANKPVLSITHDLQ